MWPTASISRSNDDHRKEKKRCNLISVLYLYRGNLNPRCPSPHDWHTLLAVVALIGNGKVVEPVKWIIPTWSWTHTPKHSTRAVRFIGNDGNPDWDGRVFSLPPAPWAAIKIVDESPTCWLVPLRLVKRNQQKKTEQNKTAKKRNTTQLAPPPDVTTCSFLPMIVSSVMISRCDRCLAVKHSARKEDQ